MSKLLNPNFLNIETIKKAYHRNHAPYFHTLTKAMKYELIQRYDASITYIDDEIGKLIAFLERSHLSEDTLIILTSDHGESLVEHGIYFDHHGLYDTSIHVPLIMKYPEFPRDMRVEGLVQHIDIVPTILDMLPEKTNVDGIEGRSLLPLIYGKQKEIRDEVYVIEEYVQRRATIRTHRHKYIFAPSKKKVVCMYCGRIHNGYEELYDLQKDPEELDNISHHQSNLKNELKAKLSNWLEGFNYFQHYAKKHTTTP